jgi:hypothetical protein
MVVSRCQAACKHEQFVQKALRQWCHHAKQLANVPKALFLRLVQGAFEHMVASSSGL